MRTIAERLAGAAAVVTVNSEENPQLAARFAVTGIPALLLLHQGRVVDRLAGNQPVAAVLAWFHRQR